MPVGGRRTLLAVFLAMFTSSFAMSSANVILPLLSERMSASFIATQWVVIGYLLAVSCALVVGGHLSEIIGTRRLFLTGTLAFTLATAGAAFADHIAILALARTIQGMGAGALLSAGLALVRQVSTPTSLPLNVGLVGSMSSLGTASGPVGAGVLAEIWGWQAIFLANVPIGLIALALGRVSLPPDRPVALDGRGFDCVGALLVTLVISSLVLTIRSLENPGVHALALAAMTLVATLALRRSMRVARRPVIDPAHLSDPQLRVDLTANFLISCVIMASLVVGPYYLIEGLGLAVSHAGLIMAASPMAVAFTSAIASRTVRLRGARTTSVAGLGIQTAGCVGMACLPWSWGAEGYLAWLLVTAVGYGVFASSNNSAVMLKASLDDAGRISGLLHLSKTMGLLVGATMMSIIFAWAAPIAQFDPLSPQAAERGLNAVYTVAAILTASALIVRLRQARPDPVGGSQSGAISTGFNHPEKEK